jgi:Fuc2NAc and GlcNAc transferase
MAMSANPLLIILVPVGMAVTAWWMTGCFRRYAMARRLLDVPNARSSHAVVTPRGGGLAIALTMLGALAMLGAIGALPREPVWALLGGGALVTLIGFTDDCRNVAPHWRLVAHFASAACVLIWLDVMPALSIFGFMLEPRWLAYGLAALYLVWLLNLTNFMDGIDGLAGVEAISVCAGGALIYLLMVPGGTGWLEPVMLASATLGFLIWNLPPAKIFMGDAGSGFVGLMLAALSLKAGSVAPTLFWSWVILLGVFVVDATITLLRRVARGEKFYRPHRSHAYQHAAQRFGAHGPVTLIIAAINLCWLFPMALLVAFGSIDGVLGLLVAYAPLAAAALWLKAGTPSAIARTTEFSGVHELTHGKARTRPA